MMSDIFLLVIFSLDQPDHSVTPESTLKSMFRGKATKYMPSHVQSAYIQNGMKLFSNIVLTYLKDEESEKVQDLVIVMEEALAGLLSSSDLEVQERASVMQQFVKYIMKHVQKGMNDLRLIQLSLIGVYKEYVIYE